MKSSADELPAEVSESETTTCGLVVVVTVDRSVKEEIIVVVRRQLRLCPGARQQTKSGAKLNPPWRRAALTQEPASLAERRLDPRS